MISYDRSGGKAGWVSGAVVVAAVLAVGGWWFAGREAAVPAPQAASEAASGPVVNLAQAPTVLPDGRPSDFSEQEWSALKEAVGSKPDGVKELQRISGFLRYQKGFEQWQTAQQSGDRTQSRAIARQLLDQLPERIKNMEMTMGESLMVCSALLADIEPDENLRVRKLEDCKTKLEALAPKLDSEQALRDAECRTEYLRRQAALVSAYQGLPDAQKDHARFEKELEDERRAVYDSPTCGR